MKTKFIYVIMAVLLMGSQMTLSAQNTDNKQKKQRPTPEQMVQMQTKQIVKTLMLDDATAAKFTPVYEKYLKELRECRMMTHKARTEKTKGQGTDAKKERPSMTDDEIAKTYKYQKATYQTSHIHLHNRPNVIPVLPHDSNMPYQDKSYPHYKV